MIDLLRNRTTFNKLGESSGQASTRFCFVFLLCRNNHGRERRDLRGNHTKRDSPVTAMERLATHLIITPEVRHSDVIGSSICTPSASVSLAARAAWCAGPGRIEYMDKR